jgi:3-oxoacyl-[acyl-carrier-protein] synthase III
LQEQPAGFDSDDKVLGQYRLEEGVGGGTVHAQEELELFRGPRHVEKVVCETVTEAGLALDKIDGRAIDHQQNQQSLEGARKELEHQQDHEQNTQEHDRRGQHTENSLPNEIAVTYLLLYLLSF